MKNVRLKQMKLRNFKGIKELDIDFNGQDTNIYGRNSVGKTSVVDAFTWLFFDKDSKGNKNGSKNFHVQTINENGEFVHHLEHSVEITLLINDNETSFKKIFKEKYTKQRGATTAICTGNENLLYIDDVPKKKKEFDERVNDLFDSKLFPIITDPFYFNEKIDWKERKRMLIDMCGDVSDNIVIEQNSELKPLESLIQSKSIDDLIKQLKSQLKPINDEKKAIPIKINEAQLATPNEIEEFDEEKYKFINEKINEFEAKKQTALSGGAIADKETELINLRNKKLLIEQEIPDVKQLKDELYSLNIQEDTLQRKVERVKEDIKFKESQQKRNEEQRDPLRKERDEIEAMQYDSSKNICPTCHQPRPFEQTTKFEEEFNIYKSSKLEDLNTKGISLMNEYKERANEIALLKIDLEKCQSVINDVQVMIAEKQKEIDNIQENFKKAQQPKIDAVNSRIKDVENEINLMKSNSSGVALEYDEKINALKEEKSRMDSIVASKKFVENQNKRILELEAREKQLNDEYNNKEYMVYLCELFIKEKTKMLLKNINSYFKLNKYIFFIENYNGGIEETCITTNEGVYYGDVNDAKRYNMGLEIINVMCKHNGIEMPIFIDNSESVNDFIHTDSQQIRLYVTDIDEKLRVEKGVEK